jgi:tetratricopeptide (TPR) repeat protein
MCSYLHALLLLLLHTLSPLVGIATDAGTASAKPYRAASPATGQYRLRQDCYSPVATSKQKRDDDDFLSVSSEDPCIRLENRQTEYKGRNVRELFDKLVRFGESPICVNSHRYIWDVPIVNKTEPKMRPGEENDEDDQEYKVQMKVGRLKLAANCAVARGELQEARVLYDRCLEIQPNNAAVLGNRALVLLKLGRAELAEEDCTVALQMSDKRASQAKLLYRRAIARRERGRMAQAEPLHSL